MYGSKFTLNLYVEILVFRVPSLQPDKAVHAVQTTGQKQPCRFIP
jgi:hypothetical protein